jgi:hypothetical protein
VAERDGRRTGARPRRCEGVLDVEPVGFSEDEEGRIVVDVDQVVRDLDGALLSEQRVQHIYTLRGGLIARMDIR